MNHNDLDPIGANFRGGYTSTSFVIYPANETTGFAIPRADVPALMKVILGAEEYARTVAPRLLAAPFLARPGCATVEDHAQAQSADDLAQKRDLAGNRPPVGIESAIAIAMQREATNAPPTKAGALHSEMLARDRGDEYDADERDLWREFALASARAGSSPLAAAKEATHALNEYRRLFGPKETP